MEQAYTPITLRKQQRKWLPQLFMSSNDLTFLSVLGYSVCPIGHLAENDELNQFVFYLLFCFTVGMHVSAYANAEIF